MRAFITGASGFIGSHLSNELRSIGHDVVAPTHRDMDITSPESVLSCVGDAKPDWIFHCAALTRGETSILEQVNVSGTASVIAAARAHTVQALIVAGTNVEYGDAIAPFDESTVPHPVTEYGRTKLLATQLACAQKDVPIAVLRFSNVYGPGGHSFIELLLGVDTRHEQVRVSDDIVRDYVHVRDVSRALIAAAERIDSCRGQVINISSGEVFATRHIVELYAQMHHIPLADIVSDQPYMPQPGDQLSNAARNDKARVTLHWQPTMSLLDTLGAPHR